MIGLVVIIFTVVGCGPQSNLNDSNEGNQSYSKELSSFFPSENGKSFHYNGTLDYGHVQVLDNVQEQGERLILHFKGEIEDLSDGEVAPRERYLFDLSYEITAGDVVEKADYDLGTLGSIIDGKVVLSLPLEVGQQWNQSFMYQGEEKDAITVITGIELTEDGRKRVTTETTVNHVSPFPNDIYVETRSFEEGKGMTKYERSIEMYQDDSEQWVDVAFDFSYWLYSWWTKDEKESLTSFLSIFSSAGLGVFDNKDVEKGRIDDQQLIGFAIRYNEEKHPDRIKQYTDGEGKIEKQVVEETIHQYFDLRIREHTLNGKGFRLKDDYYIFSYYSGEEVRLVQINHIVKPSDGQYVVYGKEYSAPLGSPCDLYPEEPFTDLRFIRGIIHKHQFDDRYILKEYN